MVGCPNPLIRPSILVNNACFLIIFVISFSLEASWFYDRHDKIKFRGVVQAYMVLTLWSHFLIPNNAEKQ